MTISEEHSALEKNNVSYFPFSFFLFSGGGGGGIKIPLQVGLTK